MTTSMFLVTLTLYIAGAVAQYLGEHTRQQPEMRRKSQGLHEWYIPPKSRNRWAQVLTGAATATGLISVIVGYLMQ